MLSKSSELIQIDLDVYHYSFDDLIKPDKNKVVEQGSIQELRFC
ncbi:2184_t:CDS:1, partial [Acaulospora morrowiae]